jgi:hypothetical protein
MAGTVSVGRWSGYALLPLVELEALLVSVKVMFTIAVPGDVDEQLNETLKFVPEVILLACWQLPRLAEAFTSEISNPPSWSETVAFA